MRNHHGGECELRRRAQELRRNATPAERLLWTRLRKRQVRGHKFRRQHVLPPFIVDFYCAPEQLAIELDGPFHTAKAKQDQRRCWFLQECYAVMVIRFSNEEVLDDVDVVVEKIASILGE